MLRSNSANTPIIWNMDMPRWRSDVDSLLMQVQVNALRNAPRQGTLRALAVTYQGDPPTTRRSCRTPCGQHPSTACRGRGADRVPWHHSAGHHARRVTGAADGRNDYRRAHLD